MKFMQSRPRLNSFAQKRRENDMEAEILGVLTGIRTELGFLIGISFACCCCLVVIIVKKRR